MKTLKVGVLVLAMLGGSALGAAPSGGASTQIDPLRRSRQTIEHVTAAQTAIGAKDKEKALRALRDARADISALYEAGPAKRVVGELDKAENQVRTGGGQVELAPLMAQLSASATYMDPSVAAHVSEAQKQVKSGQRDEAAESLRLARERVISDMALLPVEDAYARILAAEGLLNEGRLADADRMLGNIPIIYSSIELSAPLVAARFDLRSAAEAARARNWKSAEALLKSAELRLEPLRSSTPEDSRNALESIVKDMKEVRTKLESSQKPKAQEILELAQRTRSLQLG